MIIGNPGQTDAHVTVARNDAVVATDTVPPGSSKAISLAYVSALKSAGESVLVAGGAYEITSDVPVVAYQYSPLHFSTPSDTGDIYSYTNDASLLLPLHTLTGNYMASTWPTWGHGSWMNMPPFGVSGSWSGWSPGFMAIVGTADGIQATVTAATYTLGGAIAALAPGESAIVTLNRGDVLQVLSQLPADSGELTFCEDSGWEQTTLGTCPPTLIAECEGYCSVTDGDLTGTTVSATGPVAVFAGHNCTFMPYYAWACDHLEEMMFPLETWGDDFVMTAPSNPQGTGVVPTMYRVLAMAPDTTVTFEPAVHPTTTLQAGGLIQFESDADFRVSSGDKQIYVTQTLMGQDYFASSDSGDPAMGSGVPVFQARSVYTFLTPDTYTYNFVNIIAPADAEVTLDGSPVGGWAGIGSTGYRVARVPLTAGSHLAEAEGDVGFGITAYGYAPYTSYLFPGGMNIEEYVVE
ncbi:MAG: IgGFc-binding protein [Proteobacteria bacterium]|nr:IgGFc-binding protein [Pseudomonadota bacterium]